MNIIISAILSAALPLLAQSDSTRGHDALPGPAQSVSTIKTLHQGLLAHIKTVVLEERTVRRLKELPEEVEELRARLIDAYSSAYRSALNDPNLSAGQDTILEAELDQRLASVEATLTVAHLNLAMAFDRTTTLDRQREAARDDTHDLRDVERMAAENGLSDMDLMGLDMTGSEIITRRGSVKLVPRADKLATASSAPRYGFDEQAYKFGLLPSWVFSSGLLELELTELVPTVSDDLQLVGRRDDGNIDFVATLSAAKGYRVIEFRTFLDQKPFQRITMSDFRKVGDMLIPFHTVKTLDTRGVHESVVERREVRSALVNTDVAAKTFKIPADYRVQNLGNGLRPN